MSKESLKLCRTGHHPTLVFAAEELMNYLKKLIRDEGTVTIEAKEAYDPAEKGILWLGLWGDFNVPPCPVKDPKFDDAIKIEVKEGQGFICGSNPRSVLIGVYRYLSELGCRWLRPGKDGEYIPKKNISDMTFSLEEMPSYRHRGICIEGAVSYENLADIIDWAPKLGFNSYFIQFREAYTFFHRWYSHIGNPTKKPEAFSVEKAREFVKRAVEEIKKRDLLYHAVGHGWTCEPLGIPGLSWESKEYDLSPETRQYLAEVNGKREIWQGIPLNTNLCYSNPEVRELMVNSIADYLEEHPQVDVLHFWLADGSNNQCECENCKDTLPSDYYVQMLNRLDQVLSQRGLDTKIVFLIYVDLLWPPELQGIQNPDRFILMFAPITRSYSQAFAPSHELKELPKYHRNRLQFPASVDENVAFLKAWQDMFPGDSFDFDYHFMWAHYSDPGYFKIAQILHLDIRQLKEIGLNGFISCQVQRAFFPTGLGMYVMGRTLWNDSLEFEDLARDYFIHAFGPDGLECQKYLSGLSELFDPSYLRREKKQDKKEAADRFYRIPAYIDQYRELIKKNLLLQEPCHAASWRYLKHHADIATFFAMALQSKAAGDETRAEAMWNSLQRYVQENEDALQSVFDVCLFIETVGRRIFS
ncbi:MAG: DUF4838 domain-containing protein [Clostridia bacterium]|jgi:hypothetical protein